MTTLEILRAARALIAQPGRWCHWCGVTSALFVLTMVFGYYITLCLDE